MNDDSKPNHIQNQTVPGKELKAGTNETKECETELVEAASRTLALIKPDAMQANNKNAILDIIKGKGFNIVQERELQLSREKAGLFYKEHEGKSFYEDLTRWMSSAPIYALILEKEDAVQSWRLLMGPTDSIKARDIDPNSIRALFGTDGSHNATHGSDSLTSAEREINIIFDQQIEQVHVTQVQDMTDKHITQDICKPDAIPEVIKATDENKDTAQAQRAEEAKTTADDEHKHTAELVTPQDKVINQLDENIKQEHIKSQDTQNITQGNLDLVAANDEIAEPNMPVATADSVKNESSNSFVETKTKQDNSKMTEIIEDVSNEAEIKQDPSIKADSSADAEIKKNASEETGVTDASIENEVKNDASTQNKKSATFESETTKYDSAEVEVEKGASSETEVKNDTSVETANKKDVPVEAKTMKDDALTGLVVKNKPTMETELKNDTTVEAQDKKNASTEAGITEVSTEIETSIGIEVKNDITVETEDKKEASADAKLTHGATEMETSIGNEGRNDATVEAEDKKKVSAEGEIANVANEIKTSIEAEIADVATEIENDAIVEAGDKKTLSVEAAIADVSTEIKNDAIVEAGHKRNVSAEAAIADISTEIETSIVTEVKNDTTVEVEATKKVSTEAEDKKKASVEAEDKKKVSVEAEITNASTEIKTSIETEVKNDTTVEAEVAKKVSTEAEDKKKFSTEAEDKKISIEAEDKKKVSVEAEITNASTEIETSIETEVKNDTTVEAEDTKKVSTEAEDKKKVSIEAEDKKEVSVEAESTNALTEIETSNGTEGTKVATVKAEDKKNVSGEAEITNVSTEIESSTGTDITNHASVESGDKNNVSAEAGTTDVANEIATSNDAGSINVSTEIESSITTEVKNDTSVETRNKNNVSAEAGVAEVLTEIETSIGTEIKNNAVLEAEDKKNVSAKAGITDVSTETKSSIGAEVSNNATAGAEDKNNVSAKAGIANVSTESKTSIGTEVRDNTTVEDEDKKKVSAEAGIANVPIEIEASTKADDATIETQDKKDVSAEAGNQSASIEIKAAINDDTNVETKDKRDVSAETEVKDNVIIDVHEAETLEEVIVPPVQDNAVSGEPVIVTTKVEVKKTDITENETKEEKKVIEDATVKRIDSKDHVQNEPLLGDHTEKITENKAVTNNPADKDGNVTTDIVQEVQVKINSVEVDIKDNNGKITHCDEQNPDESNTVVEKTDASMKDSVVANAEPINKEEDVLADEAVVAVEEKPTVIINANTTVSASHRSTLIEEKKIDNTYEVHQEEPVRSETYVTEETISVPAVSPNVDVNVAAKATDKKVELATDNQDKAADVIIEKEASVVEEKAGLDTKVNELVNKNDVVDKTNKQVKETPKLEVSDSAYDTESVLLVTSNQAPRFEESTTNDSQTKVNNEGAGVENPVSSTTSADSLSSSSIISVEETSSGSYGSKDNKEKDDHITSSSVSSAAESLQSPENSSVTKVDQVKEKKTKNSAAVKDKKSLRAPAASGLRTASVADKKKTVAGHPTTNTKLAPTTLVKKRVPVKAEDASKCPEEKLKPKPKAGRVPRVALLAKKKATTTEATTEATAEGKPKKITSTRSLVSRLTAPTAASARKKISTDAAITTATVRTKKPADPNKKKTSPAPPVKRNPASTIGSRVTGAKPIRPSSELKPKPPSATVRRTSPPTSTATETTKKATPIKRASKPAGATATGTRVAASGLSSTQAKSRKETSSIATTKKATTAAHKKPATALKKADSVSPPNEKVNTKESVVEENHSAEVLVDQKEIQQPSEIKSAIVTEEDEKKCEKSSHNPQEEEHQNEKTTVEQVVIVPEDVPNVAENVNVSKEDIVITEQVEQKEPILETIEEKVVITEPELPAVADEKEVESVIVNEPDANQPTEAKHQTNNNASSDAEIAAITQTNITNNKPQMASLRSRFENLNNNTLTNINQLHTTPSKEIRSKSPNKISDMINRFTSN